MERTDDKRSLYVPEDDFVYSAIKTITNIMDKKYLDPVVGFFFPALGDTLMSVLIIPYLYISVFKIKSLGLTLAIILNTLVDVIVGLIPYGIGDILDIFNRSYSKNLRLIDGFIRRDEKVVKEVNRKAWIFAVLIAVSCVVIYFMFKLMLSLVMGGYHFIASLFA